MLAATLLRCARPAHAMAVTQVPGMSVIMARSMSSLETEYASEIKDILTEYDNRKQRRQALIGTVVSVKCAKSVNVEIEHQKYFPKYDKYISRHRKIMAHDETEQCQMGDIVRIVPCRPMSRRKRHTMIDILRRPKLPLDGNRVSKKPTEEAVPETKAV